MNVEIRGDQSLSAGLGDLSDDLATPTGVLLDVADAVRREARRIAPKRTGAMAGAITETRRGRTVTVAAVAPYARYVSYGSMHNPHPVPFMDIASVRVQTRVEDIADRGVSQAISKSGL